MLRVGCVVVLFSGVVQVMGLGVCDDETTLTGTSGAKKQQRAGGGGLLNKHRRRVSFKMSQMILMAVGLLVDTKSGLMWRIGVRGSKFVNLFIDLKCLLICKALRVFTDVFCIFRQKAKIVHSKFGICP